jgi:hypothetical protein
MRTRSVLYDSHRLACSLRSSASGWGAEVVYGRAVVLCRGSSRHRCVWQRFSHTPHFCAHKAGSPHAGVIAAWRSSRSARHECRACLGSAPACNCMGSNTTSSAHWRRRQHHTPPARLHMTIGQRGEGWRYRQCCTHPCKNGAVMVRAHAAAHA